LNLATISKTKVATAAKQYFSEAMAQPDDKLMKRLGLDLSAASQESRRAAALWYAAQKLYMDAQQQLANQDYFQGVIALAKRCRNALAQLPDALSRQCLEKVQMLDERCQYQLLRLETVDKEITSIESGQQSTMAQDQVESNLASPSENLDEIDVEPDSLAGFLALSSKSTQKKLQFLPDDKLVGILGLNAHPELVLEPGQRQALQDFVHLQTLYDTSIKMQSPAFHTDVKKTLETELRRLAKVEMIESNFKLAFLVSVNMLSIRGRQLGLNEDSKADQASLGEIELDIQETVHTCIKLGFTQEPAQHKIIVTLSSRAFFLGQAFALVVEFKIRFWPFYLQEFETSRVDNPVITKTDQGDCLLITMPGERAIARVAISSKTSKELQRQISAPFFKDLGVIDSRQALKTAQIKCLLNEMTLSQTLEAVNRAAYLLFLAMNEMGHQWPEAFDTFATIKSILLRKNLKLVWHEDSVPYWTLRLRTELDSFFQNKPMPKAQAIMRLLQRFNV